MKTYIYPENLRANVKLWFWSVRDFIIICGGIILSVVILVNFWNVLPFAAPDQLLLLFYGETPVGFACMIDDSIPLFALLPEYQGRDWGFFLLCAAMERVFITGASQCYVTAAESAAAAQHLLHKLQFDETGHETVFLL